MIRFCPIASGSNGNCTYLGTDDTHILIDAGLSGRAILDGLKSIQVSGDMLTALFVTHEHSDHIQGIGVLSRRFDLPIYATERTWRFMRHYNSIGKIDEKNIRVIKSTQCFALNDLTIQPFEIPHDSAEPVGYSVYAEGKKITLATDLGHITDLIREHLSNAHIVLLESNHDLEMLQNGRYPLELKRRVMGKRGHLSNNDAALVLSEVLSPSTRHVYLGHLSEENNRPLLAMDTVYQVLSMNNINISQYHFQVAERGYISEMAVLN